MVACRRAETLQTANEPQRTAAPMMSVRALPLPHAEPGNNLHRQHRQQRDRDPDDGPDIQVPGRLHRHRTVRVDTSTAGRNPPPPLALYGEQPGSARYSTPGAQDRSDSRTWCTSFSWACF